MREELQAQIDEPRNQLAAKDAQVASLQQSVQTSVAATSARTQATVTQVQTIDATRQGSIAMVAEVNLS